MGRLPFDPSKMAVVRANTPGGSPPDTTGRSGAGDGGPISVSALAARVSAALTTAMPMRLTVVGQVSGLRERTHLYFDLKDESAVISCVIFASAARRLAARPADGLRVVLKGRVEFYAPGGKVSFIADACEPVGVGAMELEFRRLCEELRALGWFAPERKRPLPLVPTRIAVITSRTGAALQDVINTARQRWPGARLALVDVRVQGEGAAAEITRAVRAAGQRGGFDVLLLTRGGGSAEDLWAFNDRELARAIVESPVPVVAAIGHETDTTIAELVADLRAATPTQAAMRIVPDAAALAREAANASRRLGLLCDRLLESARHRLRAVAAHPLLADPGSLVAMGRARVREHHTGLTRVARARLGRDRLRLARTSASLQRHRPEAIFARRSVLLEQFSRRLERAARARVAVDLEPRAARLARAGAGLARRAGTTLKTSERRLGAVGPASVLKRGFTITMGPGGRLVRSPRDVRPGDRVLTRTGEGEFGSVVEGLRQRRRDDGAEEPGLFGGDAPAP